MPRRFDPNDPELMDRPQPFSEALDRDLANLRWLNRRFGAWRLIRRVIAPQLSAGGTLRIVDLCTGSGDLPCFIAGLARSAGCRVRIDAVDAHPATLEAARRFCGGYEEIRLHQGDARTWTPSDGVAPHWVICSLALHHFTREDAISVLQRMRGMALQGALAADLERAWWTTAGLYAASMFFRERMTVVDMRKSALAAFSFREMREMADEAGWPETARHQRFLYGRQALWYENAVAERVQADDDTEPLLAPA